jgi:predicted RNA methylase
MRYWVKNKVNMFNWSDVFYGACVEYKARGEHPEIDFTGDLLAFANALHNERFRRGGPYGCAYFTPPDVAARMAVSIGAAPGMLVFDPCCGVGNLLQAAHSRGATVQGCEIQWDLAIVCQLVGYPVDIVDWLEDVELKHGADALVINPPFGKVWPHADIAVPFMERVARYHVPVAAVLPRGWLDKSQKKYQTVRERFSVLEAEDLPPGTFALTQVATTRYLLEACG